MELTAAEVADASRGVLHGNAATVATSFAIDSRVLDAGACFFALRGGRDGLDFVADAFARGAAMAVVDHRGPDVVAARPLIEVDAPMAALADVVGGVCETGDYLALDRPLPPVRQGDLLAVMTAGAYGAVQASEYNSRLLVPEVLVSGEAWCVTRPRQSREPPAP